MAIACRAVTDVDGGNGEAEVATELGSLRWRPCRNQARVPLRPILMAGVRVLTSIKCTARNSEPCALVGLTRPMVGGREQ